MADTCDVHFKLQRADYSNLGLADKRILCVDAEDGNVLEVSGEFSDRGASIRDLLDANSVVYLGSHSGGTDHGCGEFASDGERCLEFATDHYGSYIISADRNGDIDPNDIELLKEYIGLRRFVEAKLWLKS